MCLRHACFNTYCAKVSFHSYLAIPSYRATHLEAIHLAAPLWRSTPLWRCHMCATTLPHIYMISCMLLRSSLEPSSNAFIAAIFPAIIDPISHHRDHSDHSDRSVHFASAARSIQCFFFSTSFALSFTGSTAYRFLPSIRL